MYIALVCADSAKVSLCSVDPASGTAPSHWHDVPDAEIYVGFYQEWDDAAVKAKAAAKANVPESAIRLIEPVARPN